MRRLPIYEVSAQKQDIGTLASQFINETRKQVWVRRNTGVKVRGKCENQGTGKSALFRKPHFVDGNAKIAVKP